jgi:hypothetical protein
MAHLDRAAAKWELYELEDRGEEIRQLEVLDRGNVATRLVRFCEEAEIHERFGEPITLVRALMPEVEIGTPSPAEISFRCYGLEFARARLSTKPRYFRCAPEIVFGTGPAERVLDGANFPHFERLIRRKYVIPRDQGKAVGGGCIPSAGWSRWWLRIYLRSMTNSIPDGGIHRAGVFGFRPRRDRRADANA